MGGAVGNRVQEHFTASVGGVAIKGPFQGADTTGGFGFEGSWKLYNDSDSFFKPEAFISYAGSDAGNENLGNSFNALGVGLKFNIPIGNSPFTFRPAISAQKVNAEIHKQWTDDGGENGRSFYDRSETNQMALGLGAELEWRATDKFSITAGVQTFLLSEDKAASQLTVQDGLFQSNINGQVDLDNPTMFFISGRLNF